jgi:hypothetical protein
LCDLVGANAALRPANQCATPGGVTRERIRQIEAQALSRLRHPSRTLRDYLWRSVFHVKQSAGTFAGALFFCVVFRERWVKQPV